MVISTTGSFGRLVRGLRRSMDLTQDALARQVGCAAVTLRKIEADDLRPSRQIAERLVLCLKIPAPEQEAFIQMARLPRPDQAAPVPLAPLPTPDEIGNDDLSGRAVRGYALSERLGTGGIGVVYRATQAAVGRDVAIKIFLPHFANQAGFIRCFDSEARIVTRLEHPHIVPLYDYWREPGVACLVMRLLGGGSLHTYLNGNRPLPVDTILRILEQVGAALAAAHRLGVIHCDVKPANILLDEYGNAYLTDFGISRWMETPLADGSGMYSSPDYLPPELIRSDNICPQSDIYSLGIMLFELLTGIKPFQGDTPEELIEQHLSKPLPPVSSLRPDLPAGLDAVITRAAAKLPAERYPEIQVMLADVFRAAAGFPAAAMTGGGLGLSLPAAVENPYKGLQPFLEADAANFYGRESLIQRLVGRMGEASDLARFLAVAGPSGSGKSSVVKAGLVPALRNGALPGSGEWFITTMVPGAHPFEELALKLTRTAQQPPENLVALLRSGPRGLIQAAAHCLPDDPAVELVLVIDQFEEIFTLMRDERRRSQLLDILLAAVLEEDSRVRIVITLRADFLDRPLSYVDFGEMLRQRMEIVLPLTVEELELAIRKPAERVGVALEAGLEAAILHDFSNQPGALPLLQFALRELFGRRAGRVMTRRAYHAMGGVMGVLGQRADEVFVELAEPTRELARQLFLRLVTLGEGVEDTRRRVRHSEVKGLAGKEQVDAVIEAFSRSRLLTLDSDPLTREATLEVAHEALLREWPRLRGWIEDSRADMRMQRLLAAAAAEWQEAGKAPSFLLSGGRLAQFEGWAGTSAVALTGLEAAFLAASTDQRKQQEQAEAERQRRELETAQKLAETERQRADEQAQAAVRLAVQASIGLAAQSLMELEGESPERAVLLALEALDHYPYTPQAEAALGRAVQQSRPYISIRDGGTNWFAMLAWSPDGRLIATASSSIKDLVVSVWDVAEAREIWHIIQPAYEFCWTRCIDWSPDGSRLVVCRAADACYLECNAVEIWDMHLEQRVARIKLPPENPPLSTAWSPDGRSILAGLNDGTVRIYSAETLEEQFCVKAFKGGDYYHGTNSLETDVAWSPSGQQFAASATDGAAKIWDAQTYDELVSFSGYEGALNRITWSPDGQRVATTSMDGTARVWDARSGAALFGMSGHRGWVRDVGWSADGDYIATAGEDNLIQIWHGQSGEHLLTLRGGVNVWNTAWSPITKHLAVRGEEVRVLDLSQEPVRLHGSTRCTRGGHFSPDGQRVATVSMDGAIRIWDPYTGKVLLQIDTGRTTQWIEWSPDGGRVVVDGMGGPARVWDAHSGKLVLELKPTLARDFYGNVGWSPDGHKIAATGVNKKVDIFDAHTGELTATAGTGECYLYEPSWSPDSSRFATGMAFKEGIKNASIWDGRTGALLMELEGVGGNSWQTKFSPDGKRIAVASWGGFVLVFDAASGERQLMFCGHKDAVYSVAWSPDGKRIASGESSGEVKVWDADSMAEVLSFKVPGKPSILDWSPDGKLLLVTGEFNTPVIMPVWTSTEALLARARQVIGSRRLTPEERAHFGLPAR